MKIKNKFKEYVADICVKIFQIVFAMLVIGMFLRDRFEIYIFYFGLFISLFTLTTAITLYYDFTIKEEGL